MNTIPKWAILAALAMILVASAYVVHAARVRIKMDKKATELLEAQEKK